MPFNAAFQNGNNFGRDSHAFETLSNMYDSK